MASLWEALPKTQVVHVSNRYGVGYGESRDGVWRTVLALDLVGYISLSPSLTLGFAASGICDGKLRFGVDRLDSIWPRRNVDQEADVG